MSWVVGIDGCKGGWIAAGQKARGGEVRFEFLENLLELEAEFPGFRLAAIDMPIGLTHECCRQCDLAAKVEVGKRRNSIFMTPPREVIIEVEKEGHTDLEAKHDSAKDRSMKLGCKMPSRQSVAIFSKIVEVDKFLSGMDLPSRVMEVHPEFSFRCMKGSDLLYPKKRPRKAEREEGDWKGKLERLQLIAREYPERTFELGRELFKKGQVRDDDLHDCLAALWSAWRKLDSEAVELPRDPAELAEAKRGDCLGRPMVITG